VSARVARTPALAPNCNAHAVHSGAVPFPVAHVWAEFSQTPIGQRPDSAARRSSVKFGLRCGLLTLRKSAALTVAQGRRAASLSGPIDSTAVLFSCESMAVGDFRKRAVSTMGALERAR
jgi:hypothetical protein